MAVYKSTYCYPFLNSIDIRVARTGDYDDYPVQYLKCKVDTSNKKVTGYKIRLLDGDNKQIFPRESVKGYVSPLKELQSDNMLDIYNSEGINSGINGTYLQLPFFQSYYNQKLTTHNAIYYKPQFMADHIILTESLASQGGFSLDFPENLANWEIDNSSIPGEKCLKYKWPVRMVNFYTQTETPEKVKTDYNMYYVATSTDSNDGVVYVVDDADASAKFLYACDNGENRIELDGELISTNQIIFVASDSAADATIVGFYYVSKVVNDSVITTLLRPLSSWNTALKTSGENITTVSKADKFHNTNWKTDSSNMITEYIAPGSAEDSLWCDYQGNPIPNLGVSGGTYKWEITLYQGTCSISGTPMVADYQHAENENWDTTIGAGAICGSCTERIQIASDEAFLANGELNEDAILPGLKSDTLVLQTRYIDLSNIPEGQDIGIFNGNRNYVKSYTETYGYVYPETSGFDAGVLNNATHAQFFKHSNQESAILDTDIVDYGFSENVEILFYSTKVESSSDYQQYGSEEEWEKEVPVTNRLLVVGVGSLPPALTGIASGEKVLLTHQSSAGASTNFSYRNGVYRYYTLSHNNQTYHCLERAASYTSWSAYIGKIIYVRKGSLGGTNQQSLAQAGTYTLWNPLSSTTGDSGLGFTTELPILLFQNKLKDNRTYDFFSDSSVYPTDGIVDGEYLQNGNIVLCSDGSVKRVTSNGASTAEGGEGTWEDYTKDGALTPDAGDYTYFTHGIIHSQRVFRFPSIVPCWDLHTAKVLKNSANYTYISPSLLVQAGMKLKLTQGHMVKSNEENVMTPWLSIKAVNTILYCIRHEALLSPSSLVAEKSSVDGTPWRYELRTHFRTSDENPFYIDETPYLVLYKNSLEYSDLAMIKKENSTSVSYTAASAVTGRSVKLSAQYKQYTGSSWESYRWTLYDSNGTLLQDTGKKYDKDMSVVFYGLSDDESDSGSSVYYATVYVEDELDNTLQYTLKLLVVQAEPMTLGFPLTADFDCDVQAIRLEWQDNGMLIPAYRVLGMADTGVDYKYCSAYSMYWDGGILYKENSAFITGKNGSQAVLVDYSAGSTIKGEDGDGAYADVLSRAEKYGVNYYTYFNKVDNSHKGESDFALTLTTQKNAETGSAKNELYFETQVTLMDNFCGDILSWQVQGKDWDGIQDPYTTLTGKTNNKGGYIEFRFKTQDNITAEGAVNTERNTILFIIEAYDAIEGTSPASYQKTVKLPGIELFPITSSLKTRYYLQLQSVVGTDDSYMGEDYEYLHLQLDTPLYIRRDENKICYTGGEYALGNLCLVKADSGTSKYFTYWVEDRPLLANPAAKEVFLGGALVQQFLNSDRTYGSLDGVLCWPGSDGDTSVIKESDWFWRDGTGTSSSPENWEDVDSSEKHVEIITAMDRHYTLDNLSYHILCKIVDVDGLYNELTTTGSVPVVTQVIDDEEGDEIGSLVSFGTDGAYGTISIEQIKEV